MMDAGKNEYDIKQVVMGEVEVDNNDFEKYDKPFVQDEAKNMKSSWMLELERADQERKALKLLNDIVTTNTSMQQAALLAGRSSGPPSVDVS